MNSALYRIMNNSVSKKKKVNTVQLKFNKNVSKILYLSHNIDKLSIKQLFI